MSITRYPEPMRLKRRVGGAGFKKQNPHHLPPAPIPLAHPTQARQNSTPRSAEAAGKGMPVDPAHRDSPGQAFAVQAPGPVEFLAPLAVHRFPGSSGPSWKYRWARKSMEHLTPQKSSGCWLMIRGPGATPWIMRAPSPSDHFKTNSIRLRSPESAGPSAPYPR